MRFHKNAQVLAADGTMIGTVERLIVDPGQTDVTHLVVGQGALLDEDTLVPVDEVDRTTSDDTVVLRSGANPKDFEPFIEDRYRRTTVQRPMFGPPGLSLYPLPNAPRDFVDWSPSRPEPTSSTGDTPGESPAIEPGAPVVTSDDQSLGKVTEVVTSDDGTIDGLVAESGFLWFKKTWIIPVGWIEQMTEDHGVRISATKAEALDRAGETPMWMNRTDSNR